MVKGFLESMRRKEQVAKGDRSDPLLAAVDALVARPLTYPEWEKDVAKAVGAVKASLGHSEASSGQVGLMRLVGVAAGALVLGVA